MFDYVRQSNETILTENFRNSITELMIMKASSVYFILTDSCPDYPANIQRLLKSMKAETRLA